MKNYFMLKLSLLMLMLVVGLSATKAQDSVKKAVVHTAKTGTIPINPKTGKPYSRYGYGNYAKTYREKQKADSIKKATAPAIQVATTTVATTPPDIKPYTPAAPVRIDKSLKGQYQYLLTKVYNYQKPFVDAMWKNLTDTLRNTRNQLNGANSKLAEQNKTIAGLQADVTAKEQALTKTDTISLLGIALAKGTYNIIMWGLVLILGVIAGVVIAQSGGNRKEAVHRTTLFNELEEEFKTYKVRANEKEKKLARELQTERNKVDELMGRG